MALINGDNGNNSLFGTGNNDTINGKGGDDFLNGLSGSDTLNGGAGNDNLVGFQSNDVLNGGSNNDQLDGGVGIDVLTGGAGADSFLMRDVNQGLDIITDFVVADDSILVSVSRFGVGTGGLDVGEFRIGSAAVDADDRFIYNQTTGDLFFDSDGVGGVAQVQIAALSANLAMTNNDIVGALI